MLRNNFPYKKKYLGILIIFLFFLSTTQSFGQSTISIYTEKEIYSYGDFLTFTIEVPKKTDEFAILHIIDENGKKSSAIPIKITDLKTVVPSPFPFEDEVYPLGMYTLEIEYSGTKASTQFELIDSGNIVIPSWIREFAKYWYNGAISDQEFAYAIEFLIREEIIVIPQVDQTSNLNEAVIPTWIKINTGWWIDRIISDNEYVAALQYLIKVGIIVV